MASSPHAGPAARARLARKLGLALAVFAATLVLDRALGWFGFRSEAPAYPVAPPFYESTIENIEYTYTRRTNDRGIRYRQIPLAKPPGTYRVVLVGDSFTEGACVEVEQRWSDRIEQRIAAGGGRPVELINCGEAGTHPVDYARTLVQLGLEYEPDAVLVGIYFDDVPNTPPDLDPAEVLEAGSGGRTGLARAVHALWPHASARLTVADAGRATQRRTPRHPDLIESARRMAGEHGLDEASFERWLQAIPAPLLAAASAGRLTPGLMTHVLTRPAFFYEGIGLETDRSRAQFRALARLLDAMAELCRRRGIRFGVVLMPSVHQYDPDSAGRLMASLYAVLGHPLREEWTRETTALQGELAAWAAGQPDVPFLDLVPVFRRAVLEAAEPLSYAIDPHWTPAGHALAAGAIGTWMEASGLVPPP